MTADTIPTSPEVQAHADQQRRRHVTRKARSWLVVMLLGAAFWAGLILLGIKAAGWLG